MPFGVSHWLSVSRPLFAYPFRVCPIPFIFLAHLFSIYAHHDQGECHCPHEFGSWPLIGNFTEQQFTRTQAPIITPSPWDVLHGMLQQLLRGPGASLNCQSRADDVNMDLDFVLDFGEGPCDTTLAQPSAAQNRPKGTESPPKAFTICRPGQDKCINMMWSFCLLNPRNSNMATERVQKRWSPPTCPKSPKGHTRLMKVATEGALGRHRLAKSISR